jgi:flagellar basal body rod protein FlgC
MSPFHARRARSRTTSRSSTSTTCATNAANCATFCPYEGRPYRDKLTLFSTEKALLESENDGGWFPDPAMPCVKLRLSGEIYLLDLSSTALKSQPGSIILN